MLKGNLVISFKYFFKATFIFKFSLNNELPIIKDSSLKNHSNIEKLKDLITLNKQIEINNNGTVYSQEIHNLKIKNSLFASMRQLERESNQRFFGFSSVNIFKL